MEKDRFTGLEKLTLDEIKKKMRDHSIDMIRLEYTDILGINRGKLMPASMVDDIFEEGIAFAAPSLLMAFNNEIIPSKYFSETSDDMKVMGDASTFTILPHCEHTALVLGDLYYKDKPLRVAPREFLKRMIEEYHKLGFDPIAASELEFYVYNKLPDGSVEPYSNHPCSCYTANKRIDPKRFLYKLTQSFEKIGFNVLYMNHEYYPGQFEYNWKHSKILRAADEGALFKALSKDIAEMDDLMVTFMAKPRNAAGGSGCHFHISLNDLKSGENVCFDKEKENGISDVMRYFIGGLIKHAKGISPFLAPTVNCYKRYQPDSFAPIYIGWGYDNRTTYIRIPDERGKGTRLEVRAGSAAANTYLALGSILAAGLDGIKNQIEPPEVVTTDLYHDESKQDQVLPNALYKAIDFLEEDQWLQECIGAELIEVFSNLKRSEITEYKKYVTDWEWNTYSYHN
ncbi:glutamine synthetase family protein [Anaeromicropila populeti]|uniref:glutamine synthetase n=1 Tax=Anaeromicropila populeti TaxID=37658 RepID=A0A1I6KZ87_9FIRM|nr:glutamine synthetase family protein [Anaeromicropila populeti]SFR96240.1 glutamine synthetase [Anaeromicropila populeti]